MFAVFRPYPDCGAGWLQQPQEADMGFASLQADIIDRRSENGASIIYEDQFPQGDVKFAPPKDLAYTAKADRWELTAAEREFLLGVLKQCEERLSREMTLVCKLNEQKTHLREAHYLSKGEAAKMTEAVPGGMLLDLDHVYGGMLFCGTYLFVSEQTLAEGLCKYEHTPVALLRGLLAERIERRCPAPMLW
jgi:hypothetical protein